MFIFLFREEGKAVFWIGGIMLSAAVGPAQASSRSLLTRMTPPSMQGEVFGLYATTGRVMSFMSPWLWAAFIGWFGATHYGILGLMVVVGIGLVMTLVIGAEALEPRGGLRRGATATPPHPTRPPPYPFTHLTYTAW